MSVLFDDSELRDLAKDLRSAPRRLTRQVEGLLDTHAERAAVAARSDSPKDRPWLGTPQGIVVRRTAPLVRTIVSPRDPEGESVGYRQEYGTSVLRPRPFLVPAVRTEQARFNRAALDALVKATL